MSNIANMATRQKTRPRTAPVEAPDDEAHGEGPPYIHEWLRRGPKDADTHWSDIRLAKALGVSRDLIFDARKHPERVKGLRLAQIALKLGIHPAELWFKPNGSEHRLYKLAVDAAELDK